jgi:hypothetical protein
MPGNPLKTKTAEAGVTTVGSDASPSDAKGYTDLD